MPRKHVANVVATPRPWRMAVSATIGAMLAFGFAGTATAATPTGAAPAYTSQLSTPCLSYWKRNWGMKEQLYATNSCSNVERFKVQVQRDWRLWRGVHTSRCMAVAPGETVGYEWPRGKTMTYYGPC